VWSRRWRFFVHRILPAASGTVFCTEVKADKAKPKKKKKADRLLAKRSPNPNARFRFRTDLGSSPAWVAAFVGLLQGNPRVCRRSCVLGRTGDRIARVVSGFTTVGAVVETGSIGGSDSSRFTPWLERETLAKLGADGNRRADAPENASERVERIRLGSKLPDSLRRDFAHNDTRFEVAGEKPRAKRDGG